MVNKRHPTGCMSFYMELPVPIKIRPHLILMLKQGPGLHDQTAAGRIIGNGGGWGLVLSPLYL